MYGGPHPQLQGGSRLANSRKPFQSGGASPSSQNASFQSHDKEVEESPKQRQDLKVICDKLAAAEREGGYQAAKRAFDSNQDIAPAGLMWKVQLELAECAKRGALLEQVRYHLTEALQAQPRVVQVWLEASRTFEELGEPVICRKLLEQSLDCCGVSEPIMLKLIRMLERLGDLNALRNLVGSLRREPLERVYKVLIEAAHVEVRAGKTKAARGLFRYLMTRMPHQGPIFCEACRIEGLLGDWSSAFALAERGVQTSPKHGPLWFSFVRLAEKARGASAARDCANAAVRSVCHELHWKFHFEVAAAFSREGNLQASRQGIGLAALNCPKHLRWKVWLLASRSELWDGSVESSRKLLARATLDAPIRMQAAVCIERARTEEFLCAPDSARQALEDAHMREGHDWKVCLESIFMEVRQGCLSAAKSAATNALELHPATGRLWAASVALEHSSADGVENAMTTCRRAAQEVPKSGEVWCECARIFMNPLGIFFHLDRAHKCLEFAVHLTPQYGDSFLELLRLRFLLEIRSHMKADALAAGFLFASTDGNEGEHESTPTGTDSGANSSASSPSKDKERLAIAVLVAQRTCEALREELRDGHFHFRDQNNASAAREKESGAPPVPLSHLEVLCAYADPNYGFLWFWCRQSALSSPREVHQKMHQEIVSDLLSGTLWTYIWAVACSVFGLSIDSVARSEIPGTEAGQLKPHDFSMGSVRLSQCFAHGIAGLEKAERQRLIFGSDILCV